MARHRTLTVLLLCLLVPLAGSTSTQAGATAAAAPAGIPRAHPVAGQPLVGPLFSGPTTKPHGCTASVLRSPRQDLILTAAHCIHGTGAGELFAPAYESGRTPYRVWRTTEAYVDPAWIARQDPHFDFAIVRVARQSLAGHSVGVQDVVGDGAVLGSAPVSGQRLTVPAYPAGLDDRPIDCAVTSYRTGDYPSFTCAGYVGGTSGAPWLVAANHGTSLATGVIGGLHHGGCVDYISYSAPFGAATFRLWLRAALGRPGDVAPQAGSDGC